MRRSEFSGSEIGSPRAGARFLIAALLLKGAATIPGVAEFAGILAVTTAPELWRARLRRVLPGFVAAFVLTTLAGCPDRQNQAPVPITGATSDAVLNRNPFPALPPAAELRSAGPFPKFREIAEEAGVDFVRYDDFSRQHRLMEGLGGGVALFDYDGDGRIDIFFTNGSRWPLPPNDRSHGPGLFRNLGGLRFEPAAESSGLSRHHGYFTGTAVGDYNADGFDDLFLAAFGPDLLLRNNGDGTFSDVTVEAGASSDLWGSSPAFADLNRDGNLDLVVINYVLTTGGPQDLCPNPESPDGYMQCTPAVFAAAPDVLFLGDGAGAFVDATVAAGITAEDGKGLGVLIFDCDRDGDDDIFVANDGTPNFLYRNLGPDSAGRGALPRFEECAVARGCALTYEGKPLAAMGVASGDYDEDGWRDLLVTNYHAETSILYRNLQGQAFADETRRSGLGPPSRDTLGFGTEFLDYDNDGRLDLVVTNGHVDDFEWKQTPEPYRMRPQVFRNEGSRFADVSAEAGPFFRLRWIGRGLAVADLDGDGRLDFAISHQRDRSAVLHNETAAQGSVLLKLIGTGNSNRSAYGAIVEARGLKSTLVREVVGGGSFESASDRQLHFGLGAAERIPELQITWPSGRIEIWHDLAAGAYIARENGPLLRQNRPVGF